MITLKQLGAKIRVLREARGWSQTDLAGQAGTNQLAVSRIERGVVDYVEWDILVRLLDALGLDLELSARPARRNGGRP